MLVTIAICTWNRCDLLRQTLEQMTALIVPHGIDWELLVVNNNSTDATEAVIGSFAGRLPIRGLTEPRAGNCRAANLAAREARGQYILWTDDDVLVDRNWMVAVLSAFERHSASWVFGRSEPAWQAGAPPWFSDRFHGYFAVLDYGPEPFVVTDPRHSFYTLNCASQRQALMALGGFREEFGLHGALGGVGGDTDIFERSLAAGMRIVYTPDAIVRHIIPAARSTKRYQRRRVVAAGKVFYRFLPDRYPSVPWLLGLPRFFFATALDNGAAYVRSLIRGRKSEAFYYELEVLRFLHVLYHAARRGFRRSPASVATASERARNLAS